MHHELYSAETQTRAHIHAIRNQTQLDSSSVTNTHLHRVVEAHAIDLNASEGWQMRLLALSLLTQHGLHSSPHSRCLAYTEQTNMAQSQIVKYQSSSFTLKTREQRSS